MRSLDFLAVVSRPDFPSGAGPIGDNFGLRRLLDSRPYWHGAVLELNSRPTEVAWSNDGFVIAQEGIEPFELDEVGVALYLPICLEVEETLLCPVAAEQPWPRFAEEQWRPVSAYFEDRLTRHRCLNRPDRVRVANNKLMQFDLLRSAGFTLPDTAVSRRWPLDVRGERVAKNVSEGGWKSADEFSPARLVGETDPVDPWPVIWQEPIMSDRELRIYVMGDDVTVVELTRDPAVVDVRTTNAGRPSARISTMPDQWVDRAVRMTRLLGLDYAVIDAIPVGDELHVLEVNANGVWWFLPDDVGAVLETRFHAWLVREIERLAPRTSASNTSPGGF